MEDWDSFRVEYAALLRHLERSIWATWISVALFVISVIPMPDTVNFDIYIWVVLGLRLSGAGVAAYACSEMAKSKKRSAFWWGLLGLALPPLGLVATHRMKPAKGGIGEHGVNW